MRMAAWRYVGEATQYVSRLPWVSLVPSTVTGSVSGYLRANHAGGAAVGVARSWPGA
jgi:hypothetical protein